MFCTKMHGAGNSFLLTESLHGELQGEDLNGLALRLCDPARGPGADGLIVLVPAADADFGMLFYNADGSLGEMCGNGARCLARYGVEHGLVRDAAQIRIRATAGLVTARRIDETRYEVRLNDPSVIDLHRTAEAQGKTFDCAYVELGEPGIPHAVVEVPESAFSDLDALRER
jgi:diaminopimelate epimerase